MLESGNFSETETVRKAKAEYEKAKEVPAHYTKTELAEQGAAARYKNGKPTKLR